MDNKKIPTHLGTILIVIIALTAGLFVVKYEKGQEMEEAKMQSVVVNNKTTEINNQTNKQKDIYNEVMHYASQKLGVEFDYKADRAGKIGSFIQENGNEIVLMVAEENNERNLDRCSKDKECQLIDNIPYFPGIGALEVYEKNTNDSIEDAIIKIMMKNRGDSSKCVVDSYVNKKNKQRVYYIKQKKEFVPLANGDVLVGMEQQKKFEIESQKTCSKFAVGTGPGGKDFIYNPEKSITKFAFIYGEMLDAPDINKESIEFIDEK